MARAMAKAGQYTCCYFPPTLSLWMPTAARIINLDPNLVPTLSWAKKWGIGQVDNIEIVGDDLESFIVFDYDANRHRGSTAKGEPGLMKQIFKIGLSLAR